MRRNRHFNDVAEKYLFLEVQEKKEFFLQKNPDAKLISLCVGDTTEPLAQTIAEAMQESASNMATSSGYCGYGPEVGLLKLRLAIAEKIYNGQFSPDEIFISDGAATDIGRLQTLFGAGSKIAIQDPSYPAYLDTSIITHGKKSVILLPCTPENNFFFDLNRAKKADIIFICSPNNPTDRLYNYKELDLLIQFATEYKKVIICDSAYSFFVQEGLPHSIYDVEGAKNVAIEIGSFSKMAGFTGIRLSWTVVPHALCYPKEKTPINPDWTRLVSTFYNGASCISQHGGLAALSDQGLAEIKKQAAFYLQNAAILKRGCEASFETFGGVNTPYLWIALKGKSSWQAFDELLERCHIVATPGIGFGPSGEGFLRLSGFGARKTMEEAAQRLAQFQFT